MSDSGPAISKVSRPSPVLPVPEASTVLLLRNRQKDRPLQVRVLRQITLDLLEAMEAMEVLVVLGVLEEK